MMDTSAQIASIATSKALLSYSMDRLRSVTLALLGLYEERQAQRQYDILGDGAL